MIKTLLALSILFTASSVHADGYNFKEGIVVKVEPIYSTLNNPTIEERCYETQVPIYSQTYSGTGDALTGAIIGGVIGNQFGSGSGKDAMTALGAIIGANQASKPRNHIVGYTSEWRCDMVRVYNEQNVFHHYQITYKMNGQYQRINTDRHFEIGERITIP
jgi:uncharacterized protein YcfJ